MQQLLFNLRHFDYLPTKLYRFAQQKRRIAVIVKGPLLISKTAVLFNLTVNFSVFICVCSIFGFFFVSIMCHAVDQDAMKRFVEMLKVERLYL